MPRKYIKPSAPFTSGNIHIGHVRSYSIGDAYARFCRARGEDVLFAFGFDSFGLPAELGAIAGGVSPSDWVARCAEHMIGQLKRLGFSFDWERAFMSSDANMYRWSQWLFLTLLDAGLVYRGTGTVDWCDTCQTTLATIQVENGECWRCHKPVRLIQRPQWYLRISAYVAENDRRLQDLAAAGIWDENALASQRFVIGRVDGLELDLEDSDGETLSVFTPHTDAIGLARFVAVSPRHPRVEEWARDQVWATELDDLRSGGLERSSREAQTMPLVQTGRTLASPTGGEPLPVIVTPTVDGRFGATAVLGIPEHDRTDALIAERLFGSVAESASPADPAENGDPPSPPAGARTAVRYRANDFTISRQRSWGTPIPIVYCENCGADANRDHDRLRTAAPCRWERSSFRSCSRLTSSPRARATRWLSARTSLTPPARVVAAMLDARPTRSTATSTRCGCGCPYACPRRSASARWRRSWRWMTCAPGCPASG